MNTSEIQSQSVSPGFSHRLWPLLAPGLLILVELFWIIPWYRMVIRISHVASLAESSLVLGGVMLLAFIFTHLMEKMRLLQSVQLVVLLLLLFINLLIAESLLLIKPALAMINHLLILEPGAVVVLFFVVWMWWRGITLAHDPSRPIFAWRRFEVGLLLFMAYLFIAITRGDQPPPLLWFMGFLFVGFLAVVFGRVSHVWIARGARKNPFDRRWLTSTASILGITILLAAVLGSLLTGQYHMILDTLVEILRLMAGVALFIISFPGLILGMLAGALLPWFMSLAAPSTVTPTQSVPGTAYPYPITQIYAEPMAISPAMKIGCFWGLMALIILVLLIRVRRQLVKHGLDDSQTPQSLLKQGEASQLLRKMFAQTLDGLATRLKPTQRLLAAARIRRIYARLLDLSADLGHPRPPGNTPLEFLPELGEVFTTLPTELSTITQAYVRIRYGQYPETQAEIDAVEGAWFQISQEGEQLKKAGHKKLITAEVKEIQRPGV